MVTSTKSKRSTPVSDRRVTAREVAELAGVSISAVSRSFTAGASVSPRTREKVLAATQSLGYQPNVLARSLKRLAPDVAVECARAFLEVEAEDPSESASIDLIRKL